jgi:hypothetical protein
LPHDFKPRSTAFRKLRIGRPFGARYWGSTHYGCIGTIGRRPEHNPKAAFPAYATMTRRLDLVQFDGYVPTGSLTSYCVRFKGSGQLIHRLWTVRGSRDATLGVADAQRVVQVDENANETLLDPADGAVTVRISPKPIWVVSRRPIEKVELGPPTHNERPGEHIRLLDPLDEPWTQQPGVYQRYTSNQWDLPWYSGTMLSEAIESPDRGGAVWQIALAEPEKERKLAAFYGVFCPKEPIPIPGKAPRSALVLLRHVSRRRESRVAPFGGPARAIEGRVSHEVSRMVGRGVCGPSGIKRDLCGHAANRLGAWPACLNK